MPARCNVGGRLGRCPLGTAPAQQGSAPAEACPEAAAGDQIPGLDAAILHRLIEYGLIVAIPSLLLHAFLARRARRVLDEMEQVAVAFLNQIRKVEAA